MSVPVTEAPPPKVPVTAAMGPPRLPRWYRDYHGAVAAAIYLTVILAYEHYPLAHMGSVCECQNSDPTQWMWTWKWFTYALSHGHNPLLTNLIWAGAGRSFDLGAVTLAPLTAVPGIPLDALFGPVAAYNVLAFAAPVIDGWAAYRLCRYLSGARWASILAGYIYGFSAFELGHLIGHLNLIYTFVAPMLILVTLRHANGEISRRRALLLTTVLLIMQFGLSTEMLFDIGCLVAVLVVVSLIVLPRHRREILEALVIMTIAAAVTGVICSYYIYQQLRGPAETAGRASGYPADLLSAMFPTPTFRIGGTRFSSLASTFVTGDIYERNNYLGLPLIGILLAFAFSGWRLRATRVIVVGTLAAFILALGVTLTIAGQSSFSLPYDWLLKLPLFNETTPTRYGMFVALGGALATALWVSWARGRTNTTWRWLVALAAVAFLLPGHQPAGWIRMPAQPAFFTTQLYRHYLKRNEIVMTIPYSQSGDEMLWQADTDMYFRLAGGYMGYPPPWEANIPIIHYQLYFGAPIPPANGVAQLRSLVASQHIGVVLIQQTEALDWPGLLIRAGFHRRAVAGGIEVFAPPAGLASVS